jgi:hypothetical protein
LDIIKLSFKIIVETSWDNLIIIIKLYKNNMDYEITQVIFFIFNYLILSIKYNYSLIFTIISNFKILNLIFFILYFYSQNIYLLIIYIPRIIFLIYNPKSKLHKMDSIKKDINDTINVPNIKAFQKNVKLTLNDRIGTNEINKE